MLKEKTIALLQDIQKAKSDKLWTEAMCFSADVYNRFILTDKKSKISRYEKWSGFNPEINDNQAFGTVGYMRPLGKTHKLEVHGKRYIMLGLAHNHLRGTVQV